MFCSTTHVKDDAVPPKGYVLVEENLNEGTLYGKFLHVVYKKDFQGVFTWGRGGQKQLGHSQFCNHGVLQN